MCELSLVVSDSRLSHSLQFICVAKFVFVFFRFRFAVNNPQLATHVSITGFEYGTFNSTEKWVTPRFFFFQISSFKFIPSFVFFFLKAAFSLFYSSLLFLLDCDKGQSESCNSFKTTDCNSLFLYGCWFLFGLCYFFFYSVYNQSLTAIWAFTARIRDHLYNFWIYDSRAAKIQIAERMNAFCFFVFSFKVNTVTWNASIGFLLFFFVLLLFFEFFLISSNFASRIPDANGLRKHIGRVWRETSEGNNFYFFF